MSTTLRSVCSTAGGVFHLQRDEGVDSAELVLPLRFILLLGRQLLFHVLRLLAFRDRKAQVETIRDASDGPTEPADTMTR